MAIKLRRPAPDGALSRGGDPHYLTGMHLDLTDEEAAALARHLCDALDYYRYPFASRLDPLKPVLARLDPPTPHPERLSPLRPGLAPRVRPWSKPPIGWAVDFDRLLQSM